jgi:hypothetical protein
MFRNIWILWIIFWHNFSHFTRIYSLWHMVYSFLYHRKYRKLNLDTGLSPNDAWNNIRVLQWRKDSWKELFDSVGDPHWIQHCINEVHAGNIQPEGSLDCDDFSIWCANCISVDYAPVYFTQSYMKSEFAVGGHAVCVYKENGSYYHVSNWGIRGPFVDLADVSADIIKGASGLEPIGWSLYDHKLKLLNFSSNVPEENIAL